ncbi:hypothetical protein KBA01_26490 [Kozakia baliensis]|nr:hypothetical protein KBA01_26490 [Kozakia baliensis]
MNSDFAKMPIKLAKLGVWLALFERVKDRDPALGMVFLDGTNIKAHHKAARAAKKRGISKSAEAIVRRLAAHVEALAARSA